MIKPIELVDSTFTWLLNFFCLFVKKQVKQQTKLNKNPNFVLSMIKFCFLILDRVSGICTCSLIFAGYPWGQVQSRDWLFPMCIPERRESESSACCIRRVNDRKAGALGCYPLQWETTRTRVVSLGVRERERESQR